jgi:Uncharacterised nucleotidyltransferase
VLANTLPAPAGIRDAPASAKLEERVERLIDHAPSVAALRAHRLHLAAARIWRARGTVAPESLLETERLAELMAVAAPVLLERARAAYDGRLLLMKGPEVAAGYAHPADRVFRDLDLLADDASAAQRALLDAGFVEFDDPDAYADTQHLCPLFWPGLPLVIEVHRHPNQPAWLPAARVAEIFECSTPSATGVDGLLAPVPELHALLLVAHSWINHPLGRMADLLDLATILGPGDRSEAERLARRWGWDGMWRVTLAASDAVFGNDPQPRSFSLWARHLGAVRDRTVLENHFARIAAPVCALPPRRLPGAMACVLRGTATRRQDERWANKLRRSRLAVAHAFMPKSSHEQRLAGGGRSHSGPRRGRARRPGGRS